jgi:hypothetical protein
VLNLLNVSPSFDIDLNVLNSPTVVSLLIKRMLEFETPVRLLLLISCVVVLSLVSLDRNLKLLSPSSLLGSSCREQ